MPFRNERNRTLCGHCASRTYQRDNICWWATQYCQPWPLIIDAAIPVSAISGPEFHQEDTTTVVVERSYNCFNEKPEGHQRFLASFLPRSAMSFYRPTTVTSMLELSRPLLFNPGNIVPSCALIIFLIPNATSGRYIFSLWLFFPTAAFVCIAAMFTSGICHKAAYDL